MAVTFMSCRKDEDLLVKTDQTNHLQEVIAANERLQFASPDQLKNFVNEGKTKSLEEFRKGLITYENNGFRSLMPLFDASNQAKREEYQAFRMDQRQKLYARNSRLKAAYANTLEKEIDTGEDELIADPYFASLLNRNREIEVGGKIYRYTEKGLFSPMQKTMTG
jgi:hypothetical protein